MEQDKRSELPSYSERVNIAAKACVDPSTIARYFRGGPVRGTTRRRIELTLEQMKLSSVKVGGA